MRGRSLGAGSPAHRRCGVMDLTSTGHNQRLGQRAGMCQRRNTPIIGPELYSGCIGRFDWADVVPTSVIF